MSVFSKGIGRSPAVASLLRAVSTGQLPADVVGVALIHKVLLTHTIAEETGRRAILFTADEPEAARCAADLRALGTNAWLFPTKDLALRAMESASREFEQQRLGVLGRMMQGDWQVVVAPIEAALQYTLSPEALAAATITLVAGEDLPVADLPAALLAAGYERCEQIEGAGQFTVRGGIIDVYPAACPDPIRLELWGDTVDSLAAFDLMSQRRTESLDRVCIPPATELLIPDPSATMEALDAYAETLTGKAAAGKVCLQTAADQLAAGLRPTSPERFREVLDGGHTTLLDYAGDALWLLAEPARLHEQAVAAEQLLGTEIEGLLDEHLLCKGLTSFRMNWGQFIGNAAQKETVLLDAFSRTASEIPLRTLVSVTAQQLPSWSGKFDVLTEELRDAAVAHYTCAVLGGADEGSVRALTEDLQKAGFPAQFEPVNLPDRGQVLVSRGGLSAGAAFPDAGFVIYTRGQAVARRKPRLQKVSKGAEIRSVSELKIGDHVVHAAHGIGRYNGIVQLTVQGVVKDYLKLTYDKGDVLYVPVTQLDLVSKYIGAGEGDRVKLHKLGGQEWKNTKRRVRSSVKDIAKELIALYANRMAAPGHAFPPDDELQSDFERRFEYAETDDQLRCVAEIKRDMERPVPMDRLLCGDVGFGKTEVALRAAFKCVADGKQCVILVPTTILALQHYNTMTTRFEQFPVTVEMISRFRTPKQQADILARTAAGKVDILVGTHRLLSQDIRFKDIGLFIVDEEQRFGVSQKERIKELTPNVDVLTLSATPIPRTLNMAMSGIRDMSVIEEAPQDRHPVQTYVLEHDNAVLEEALRREFRRGGQAYYLHNRTDNIEAVAAAWQIRLPEARIAVAHGKMTEAQISDVWRRVLEQEIDLLICTTIIETGIDVPNVNTLIIEDADHYGLSQLHQLRGRVGRSARRAYAYLTFRRGKVVSEIAQKRLEAMHEFTEFGAGFRIAMRDMEIRGAGNLLGAQQHGHMEAVGYDLYLRLLSDAVAMQKGERPESEEDVDCLIDLPVSAHIPEDYIPSTANRLEIYHRIADIRNEEESLDVFDELVDRFGEPPVAVQNLVDIALLRHMAADRGIYEIKQNERTLLLMQKKLDLEMGAALNKALHGRVMISAGNRPYFAIKLQAGEHALDALREALVAAEQAGDRKGSDV
ncbi:MAG: transcription-repair coupling factor [Clostridia bacterium]|nr:transcription-repair coupling factor [Clostridia bacterium]